MKTYKVINVDNFDREMYSDTLVEEHMEKPAALKKAREMNDDCDPHGADYYLAVPQDHVLHEFQP